jgi:hypothetical protein
VAGEAQLLQLPPSSLHSKLDPDSEEVKVKAAVVDVVLEAGPLVIVVSGGVVSLGGGGGGVEASMFQTSVAGVLSTFPAMSSARTENWWEPKFKLV